MPGIGLPTGTKNNGTQLAGSNSMSERWQKHGPALKILLESTGKFDQAMAAYGRELIDAEIRAMLEEGLTVHKQVLARRLGMSRNRLPMLVEKLELELP